MLADELHKDTLFRVTLTVPKSFLSPRQCVDSEELITSNEVAIRVLHKQRGTDSVWPLETLEEKVLTMREMYERMEEGGPLLVSHSVWCEVVLASFPTFPRKGPDSEVKNKPVSVHSLTTKLCCPG